MRQLKRKSKSVQEREREQERKTVFTHLYTLKGYPTYDVSVW